jgi:hypothetical protein
MKKLVLLLVLLLSASFCLATPTYPASAIQWWNQATYSNLPGNTLRLWAEEVDTRIAGVDAGEVDLTTLRILESGTTPTKYTQFTGGDQSADVNYVLPTADGTAGYVLSTDGSGVLSWAANGFTGTFTGAAVSLNAAANYAITLGGGTSAINIGTDATTQAINFGTGGASKTVTIGSATLASPLVINSGTGDMVITSINDLTIKGGSAGSVINIGTNTDGDAITILLPTLSLSVQPKTRRVFLVLPLLLAVQGQLQRLRLVLVQVALISTPQIPHSQLI